MDPRLTPGMVLGETFTIIRLIGRGGMGEVYEAEHIRLKGRVALKLLTLDVVASGEPYARFRQEATITSALRHPHIVQVLDFNEHDNIPYIVMERLEGTDLANRLRLDGPMSLRRVVALVDQVASALGAAHSKGVIHRDLKPHNVFLVHVPEQGREFAKVMDFGISKVRSAADVITDESSLLGTPAYMSPEQARGNVELDGRSDEFALATIAYEALCGQRAFHGAALEAVLHEVLHKEPRSLSRRVPGLPLAVDQVVKRGMAKDREDRYPTIVAFAEALLAAAEPGTQPEPSLDADRPSARSLRAATHAADGIAPSTPTTTEGVHLTSARHAGQGSSVAPGSPLMPVAPFTPPTGEFVGVVPGGSTATPTTTEGVHVRIDRDEVRSSADGAIDGEPSTPTTAPLVNSGGRGGPATPPTSEGVYLLVNEDDARRAAIAGRWRRLAAIVGATLAGGVIALAIAAFVLREQIREARARAASAPVAVPIVRPLRASRPVPPTAP